MSTPAVYYWDMDHTIIANDCDVSWKEFLMGRGIAPADAMKQADVYWEQYKRGELDIAAFVTFQLAEFAGRTPAEIAVLADAHYTEIVAPTIYAEARRLIAEQLAGDVPVVLLTATNSAIAAPLARELGIDLIVATEPALADGRYTGGIVGEYCGGAGKLIRLTAHAASLGCEPAQVAYYGDSTADIPVLSGVGFPVVCNPMAPLAAHAQAEGWPILRF